MNTSKRWWKARQGTKFTGETSSKALTSLTSNLYSIRKSLQDEAFNKIGECVKIGSTASSRRKYYSYRILLQLLLEGKKIALEKLSKRVDIKEAIEDIVLVDKYSQKHSDPLQRNLYSPLESSH